MATKVRERKTKVLKAVLRRELVPRRQWPLGVPHNKRKLQLASTQQTPTVKTEMTSRLKLMSN